MTPVKISPELEAQLLAIGAVQGNALPEHLWKLIVRSEQENQVLSHLFNLAQDIMCVASLDGYFQRVNPAFKRILGYELEEIEDIPYTDLVHPADRDATLQAMENLRQGESIIRFENRYRRKDGTYCWLAWASTPLLETKQVYAVARDVTRLKDTQFELASAHAQINSIMESITDAFFALDNDWCFSYVNSAAEPLLRHQRDDILGKCIWDVFPEAVGTTFYHEYRGVAETNEPSAFLEYYAPHDMWYDVSAYPSLHGISVYFRNVNERVQAEKLRIELEKEKEVRRVKSQLISMVTHDIRNPLTGAHLTLTNLEHALPNLGEAEIRDRFAVIQSQLKLMDDLIEDLMVFSSIEQRKIIHKPIEIDLDVFCSRVLHEFSETVDTQRELVYQSHNLDATAHLDPHLMQRALTNLLSNAVKYSPNGSRVEMELAADEEHVLIHIRDYGIGIADTEQAGIFEAFQRAANSRNHRGTGLGLTVVKQIVELHGGAVSVKSTLNEGSTFTVRLPRYEGE